ncbi:MAG: [Fe-Fe] hydrogenase large subunit C-terminal domain-containing protein, partial [Anaeroplasmataceae bacterium]
IFDVTFGADLTIMEEASELLHRIKNNGSLPMFTSCCPSWVKFCETFYPNLIPNISTSRSPIAMQGSLVKHYFCPKMNIDPKQVVNITVAPCTAKKSESRLDAFKSEYGYDNDIVITTKELAAFLKEMNIDFANLKDSEYDSFFPKGSSSGIIFGNSGGVMEAALRTAYFLHTGKNPSDDSLISYTNVRGLDGVKKATLDFDGLEVKVCVINKTSNVREILNELGELNEEFHFIEVMACPGGCANGGGQPKVKRVDIANAQNLRNKGIYDDHDRNKIRYCHENPQVLKVYDDFIGSPLSENSHKYLHTSFVDRSLKK